MNKESSKIQSFTDLHAWQEGHKLVLLTYRVTKTFPREEIFGLTSQLRRASVSITSNIAEGFSRHSYREKLQFYSIALGSVNEVQNQIIVARDVEYLKDNDFKIIIELSVTVHKILNGLIKGSQSIIRNS